MINRFATYCGILLLLTGIVFACKKSSSSDTGEQPAGKVIDYESSVEIFPNPERGFIRTYPVYSEGEGFDDNTLSLLRSQNVSMILRVFYLDQFKDKSISAAELNLIDNDLHKIRDAGLKAILRFAYTDDINGTDAPLDIVLQHIDQLKPVLEQNADVIAFMQAGFIGAWGEWHSSSNGLATTENRQKVLQKLIEAVPASIMIQVRTPGYKQDIFNTSEPVNAAQAYSAGGVGRIGHHNDCFLSGGDNYGTYGNIEADKEYISNEALYVPTGGETCPPTGGFDPTCDESRNEMKLLKWTYLNLDWYPATIAAWKTSGCFDEFHTYLGYRLALVKGNYEEKVSSGSNFELAFSITNKGYAPVYNAKNTSLVLKNKASGIIYTKPLQLDVRTIKPMATIDVDEKVDMNNVPAGNYDLYLRIADQADTLSSRMEYSIRLANKNGWVAEDGGLNRLNHELIIE